MYENQTNNWNGHDYPWSNLTYDEAHRILEDYEARIGKYAKSRGEHAAHNEEFAKVQHGYSELRQQLTHIRGNAQDAWGEMQQAFVATMAELADRSHQFLQPADPADDRRTTEQNRI